MEGQLKGSGRYCAVVRAVGDEEEDVGEDVEVGGDTPPASASSVCAGSTGTRLVALEPDAGRGSERKVRKREGGECTLRQLGTRVATK